MKSYHRHPPQQAPTHQEADEPVFRPLRRFNWVPVRKRPPRYHSPLVTCRRASQSALAAGGAPCGGYSNDGFAVCFRSEPPEHPNEREVASDGVVRVSSATDASRRALGPVDCGPTLARQRSGHPGAAAGSATAATRLEPSHQSHHHSHHHHHHEVLPDILNAHLPPPYATLPQRRHLPPPPPRLRPPRCVVDTEVVEPKHCCGVLVTQTVSIRWFIVMIAFVGLCCAIVGTVLGALKATGREHLTVSLLMIGVGIVLITVSGIAWRLTSHEAPSCRAMLGLRPDEPNRRFVPRVPPYGRPNHPYAAMLYPEFQYRPPPPSYQASMQEYRLRLLLLDRGGPAVPPSVVPLATPVAASVVAPTHHAPVVLTATPLSPVSPPPTYRSGMHTRPPLTFPTAEREQSRPPSYRSRTSSAGGILRSCVGGDVSCSQDTLATVSPASPPSCTESCNGVPGSGGGLHSRNPSLTLSTLSQDDVTRGVTRDTPSPPCNVGRSELLRKNHDVNTVTIVQTTDTSQVINQDTVIVSVSGQNARTLVLPSGHSEVQVTLAHV